MANQSVRKMPRIGFGGGDQRVAVKGFETLVDIIFVVDGTGSMQNLLDEVKERALSMHTEIVEGLKNKNRKIKRMRVKMLVFRDIYVDASPFEESDFYTLPEQAEEFRDFVKSIKATGGGDEPESALEAMYLALKSRFQENEQGQFKARQVIIVMTDASAHKLNDPQREGDPLYPRDIPRSLEAVEDVWEGLSNTARRLIVMAPNVWPWTQVSCWSDTDYEASAAGKGISREGYDKIIEFISGSIST